MALFPFSLVSPEKILLEKEVSMVVIPGSEGDIGVLANHAPLLTLLRPGVITVYEDEKILVKIFVDGGFAEISPQGCKVLVTEGTPLEALDRDALEIQINSLLEDIADSRTPEEREKADKALEISRAKLMEILTYKRSKS